MDATFIRQRALELAFGCTNATVGLNADREVIKVAKRFERYLAGTERTRYDDILEAVASDPSLSDTTKRRVTEIIEKVRK